MKIIQLITGSPSFGGAEAHVRDLATGLIARGHECIVVIGPPEGLLAEQLRSNGVPVLILPALKKPIHPFWDLLSLLQVVAALRKLRPDIIATHTSKAGFIGRMAARLLGIPSFFTPHGLSFIDRQSGKPIRFRLAMERLALHLGGHVIAVCDAERKLAIDVLALEEDTISTIHNGLPDRIPLRKPTHAPVVITMVARFDVQKDHATLFKALSNLLHLDWELRLAGSGPLLPSAKLLAEEYGLTSRTRFLHQCPDTPALLAGTDLFVLISNWEAFPISILEAMRSQLPVIATDVGGVSEAIEDGVNGFLVPRQGSVQIAERISLLLNSADLRHSMGLRSRRRFHQHFVWQSMLDKTEAAYASALPSLVSEAHPAQLDLARP